MNSPDAVAALRAGAPDAAGQLYAAHAEGLYQYCWLVLRSRQTAQVASRDAVFLADVRMSELRDPSMLKAWLFAIARAECDRHCPGSAGESDEPVARPQQPDAALRIMAWNAVIALTPDEREALDLVTRHGMTPPEVALVLGLPAPEVPALIGSARRHLEQALAAEILIGREGQECAGRGDALRGWTGTVTPAVRERLLEHADSCPACSPRLPRNVSVARIFGLLPRPALTGGGWAGVLSRLSDPEPLDAGGRGVADGGGPGVADVADGGGPGVADAADAEDRGGPGRADDEPPDVPTLPRDPGDGAAPVRDARSRVVPGGASRRRRGRRVYAAIAATAAVGVAAALAAGSLGGPAALSGAARRLPAAAASAQAGVGQPIPQPDSGPATPGASVRHPNPPRRAASAGAGRAGDPGQAGDPDDPGQLARATVLATPSVITPRRVPWRAPNGTVLPGPAAPAPAGAPARSPGPSASARTAAAGQLEVSPGRLDLGAGSSGQIVLTARGGPVSWSASASSADLTLGQSSGQLSPGQSVTLVIDVRRQDDAGGDATISIAARLRLRRRGASDLGRGRRPAARQAPAPVPVPVPAPAGPAAGACPRGLVVPRPRSPAASCRPPRWPARARRLATGAARSQ